MDEKPVNINEELQAIERLHMKDMKASRTGDVRTLRSLLSEDAVLMPPEEDWIRGSDALDENYRRMAEAMKDVEVTEYCFEFEEVKVLGDYAFEWGVVRGAMRPKDGDPSEPPEWSSYKVLRILKKEPGRGWRVHRAMWNANPAEPRIA